MDLTPITLAIETVGGQRELAEAIGVHPSLVSQWATGRRPVAAVHAIPIEVATNSVVTRYDLRPDVFGQPAFVRSKSPEAHPPRRRRTAVEGEAAATDGDPVSVKEVRDAA